MKRFNLLIILFLISSLVNGGFNIGIPKAVKKKVDDLDKKVEEKKLQELHEVIENAPNSPSSLEAGIVSEETKTSKIRLNWTDNSNNEDYFVIERALDKDGVPASWSVIADNVPADSDSYVDTGLASGTSYWYRVKAVNSTGESPYSNIIKFTTFAEVEPDIVDTTVPVTPSDLSAVVLSNSEIRISWTDNSDNEDYFIIERADDNNGSPGIWGVISSVVTANTRSYVDNGLTEGSTYWYRVKAGNTAGVSDYSNVISITADSVNVSSGEWVDVDGYGQESKKITKNNTTSFFGDPSLCLDNTGRPHIISYDKTSGYSSAVFYLKWNGTDWVDADGFGQEGLNPTADKTDDCDYPPSLSLDNAGNPHIAWSGYITALYKDDIYYAKWDGTNWVDVEGFADRSSRVFSSFHHDIYQSLCLDNTGYPHIVWMNDSTGNYEIYYLKWNGTDWVDAEGSDASGRNISNTSGLSSFPSICLDNAGNPHVVWVDDTSGDNEIYYLKWDGTDWVDADGSGKESIRIPYEPTNNQKAHIYPDICLDNAGNPHITWDSTLYTDLGDGVMRNVNYEINYLKWDGHNWVDVDGSGTESMEIFPQSNMSRELSFCLDTNGNPHIAWADNISGDWEIHYLGWDGIQWVDADGSGQESTNISNLPTSGAPSICTDTNGNPHIAWHKNFWGPTNVMCSDIYYLKWQE